MRNTVVRLTGTATMPPIEDRLHDIKWGSLPFSSAIERVNRRNADDRIRCAHGALLSNRQNTVAENRPRQKKARPRGSQIEMSNISVFDRSMTISRAHPGIKIEHGAESLP